MTGPVIVDTGPIVALLNRREQHHEWARDQFSRIQPPVITCEAVISEACFLLRDVDSGIETMMKLLQRNVVAVPFVFSPELPVIAKLLRRYRSLPMSFADACLVRMTEQYNSGTVLTLDGDFQIYRRNGRQVIPTLMP